MKINTRWLLRSAFSVILMAGLTGVAGCTVYAGPSEPPPGVAVDADAPPLPPDRHEVVGVAPFEGAVWIGGNWNYYGHGWHWTRGRWGHPPHHGAVWVGGRYEHGPHGYMYYGGHWR
jgi:hypothetical protein